MSRCFLFKPDGIGDFFLSTGVVRLLGREFGEENLTIAVLPVLEPVVKGQFPRSSVITLPIRKRRVLLNVFVANCLRCFPAWNTLIGTKAEVSISLRHMRDYLQNILFYSVRSRRRIVASNLLLGNGRPVRRWTEKAFLSIFGPEVVSYPENSAEGIPSELETNRRIVSLALGREVNIREIWPELKPLRHSFFGEAYHVCAPFSSGPGKDFPLKRWVELFMELESRGKLPSLCLVGSSDQSDRLVGFLELLGKSSATIAAKTRVVTPGDLQEFIDFLSGAECVFTVDTAAAHAASALDCRTLVLYSGLHQGMFAPWFRSSRQYWAIPKQAVKNTPWHDSWTNDELLDFTETVLGS